MTEAILATNRKALFSYSVKDTFEAGIVLEGWEVKSIRKGNLTIGNSFVGQIGDELYLMNASITPYAQATSIECSDRRNRKLLLHRRQINKILGTIKTSGCTAVPLKAYTNRGGLIKLEIAIVQGKSKFDKREAVKDRDWKRDKAQMMKLRGSS